MEPGDRIWQGGPDGWACSACRWPQLRKLPTWEQVRTKIQHRAALGVPVGLDLLDVQAIVDALSKTPLTPQRRGTQERWRQQDVELPREKPSAGDSTSILIHLYGRCLDSLEYRFPVNMRTQEAFSVVNFLDFHPSSS